MDLTHIINEAADEADSVLSGIRIAKEALPMIHEWIAGRHPELSPADQKRVTAGVMQVLTKEGFFDVRERRTGLFGGEDTNELVG